MLREAITSIGLGRLADALGVVITDPDEAALETLRRYGIERGWWRDTTDPEPPEPESPAPAPEPDPEPESPVPEEGFDEAARGLLAAFDRLMEDAQ